MKNSLFICLAMVFAISGCSGKRAKFEAEFIGGCVGPDGTSEQKKLCSCMADKLEERHSIDELYRMAEQQPRQLLLEAVSLAPSCGAKI